MRLLTGLAAALLLTACSTAPENPAPYEFSGLPAMPAAVSIPDTAPPQLPREGAVGRGALLYLFPGTDMPCLVLESGAQFCLPPPENTASWDASTDAQLSPDGRWVGYRRLARSLDRHYLIQDLTGAQPVIGVDGTPLMWSADARFLALYHEDSLRIVDVTSGNVVTQKWANIVGITPDGDAIVDGDASDRHTRNLRIGSRAVSFKLGPGGDHECWCVGQSRVALSPAGDRITMLLRFQNGLNPDTGEKSRDRLAFALSGADTATGVMRERVELADGFEWALLADTGDGLLLMRWAGSGRHLILANPDGSNPRVLTTLPETVRVAAPGSGISTGE